MNGNLGSCCRGGSSRYQLAFKTGCYFPREPTTLSFRKTGEGPFAECFWNRVAEAYAAALETQGLTGGELVKPIKVLMPIVALVASTVFGQSTNFVVPAGLENVEGNDNLAIPLTAPNSARTQSLYTASNFAGPTIISKIAYRLDSNNAPHLHLNVTDIQINFSTFTGTILSTTFAANVGSDEEVVFNRGSLLMVMAAVGSPNAFDLVIELDHPFAYDPAVGGLLVDIMKFSSESDTFNFDAQTTSGVTTIYSNNVLSSAGGSLNRVFVARLTAIPEPAAASILLLGCACLTVYRGRAKRLRILEHRSANRGRILS
jgi:hypothetical protein